MKRTRFFIVLLSTAFLLSCDPLQRIRMINNSNAEAFIEWKIKEDSVLKSPLFISNATDVKFTLQTGKPYNKINLSAASGKWTEAALKNLADDLESFSIIHKNDTLKLTAQQDIVHYLLQRRTGFGNTRIDIVLK